MKFFKQTQKIIISHLTDIEGNLRYFKKWAERSNSLQIKRGKLSFRESDANQKFIYGGDFCDKGPGDLRIGRQLVDFKLENPSKVSLISGNREIKCRRFTYELNTNIQKRLLNGLPAYWNKKVSPRDYVIQQMKKEGGSSTYEEIEKYISSLSKEACQTLYLKWMLNETMGCAPYKNKPGTFEFRRIELAELTGVLPNQISDEMVTQSFIDSVLPEGIVTQYLKLAQLGEVVGDTLFIHGAVTPENIGYVPGLQSRIPDAKEWIEALNNWYKNQITDWMNNPTENDLHSPGHKPLDEYVLFNPKSIVTTNWYTRGKLAPIHDSVVDFLNKAGIYRVISGHQPFADFPLTIRHANLEVIVGDTGYSDVSANEDNRGQALHNLQVTQMNGSSFASIDAIFKDGSSQIFNLPSRTQCLLGNDTDIGHFTDKNQLIRPLNATQLGSSQLNGHYLLNEEMKFERKNWLC